METVTLSIKGDGGTASGYHVWLNGQDISKFTRGLSLNMDVGEANTATFTIYVNQLEIDAETEAKLMRAEGPERTSFLSRFREWV